MTSLKAKPFLKWAGGKTQLLQTINFFLPKDLKEKDDVTYIEPFVGGGAVLFHMLQHYPNIKKAVINDINGHLINTYTVIKEQPNELIEKLSELEVQFKSLSDFDEQKSFFLSIREKFNGSDVSAIDDAAFMIFLNRTCFNGLYRENSKGKFNVPFGKYKNPTICDSELILADSQILQRVTIVHGDFAQILEHISQNTFVYFDPPYRPLNATSNFNSYVKEAFNDDEQIRLKLFLDELNHKGCHVMLSNSDSRCGNQNDDFFDALYDQFIIERVYAKRTINSDATKRGKLTELLIRNYSKIQGNAV